MHQMILALKYWFFGLGYYSVTTERYQANRECLPTDGRRLTTQEASNAAVAILERLLKERKLRYVLAGGKAYAIEVLLCENRRDIQVAVYNILDGSRSVESSAVSRKPYDGLFRFYFRHGDVFFMDVVDPLFGYDVDNPLFVYTPTWWTPSFDADFAYGPNQPQVSKRVDAVDVLTSPIVLHRS